MWKTQQGYYPSILVYLIIIESLQLRGHDKLEYKTTPPFRTGSVKRTAFSGKTAILSAFILLSATGCVDSKKIHNSSNVSAISYESYQGLKKGPEKSLETGPEKSTEKEKLHRLDRIGVSFGDVSDAGTTAVGLWSGVASEANPILAPFGDAAPIVMIPLKLGLKHGVHKLGATKARANLTVDSAGILAACANIMTLSGAAMPVALATGMACGTVYHRKASRDYERATGRTIDGAVVSKKRIPKP